jgi:hypothetical protein
MDSNFEVRRDFISLIEVVEEASAMNARQGRDALEISLKRAYNILGQARGWADVVGHDVLWQELGHMQEVIEDYQLQLLKGKSLRTRPKSDINFRRLPNL